MVPALLLSGLGSVLAQEASPPQTAPQAAATASDQTVATTDQARVGAQTSPAGNDTAPTKSGKAAPRSDKGRKPARKLDLTTPDVRTVISPEELEEPLPSAEQDAQADEAATVQVKTQEDAPVVLGGFGALWWAMKHPSQAWRIFTPIE